MFGVTFLSLFVILGLSASNWQSRDLRNKIVAKDPAALRRAELLYGSTFRSNILAGIGFLLSSSSIALNLYQGVQTALVNSDDNKQALTAKWLIAILTESVIANLYGFITLDRLGARNGKLLESLHGLELRELESLHQTALEQKDSKIKENEKIIADNQNRLEDAQSTLYKKETELVGLRSSYAQLRTTYAELHKSSLAASDDPPAIAAPIRALSAMPISEPPTGEAEV